VLSLQRRDYEWTLNLPRTSFPMKADLARREPLIQRFWRERQIYRKMLERNSGGELFILHDGPPYSNGDIHIGHALNKVLKDIIVKYKSMRGYRSPFVPGWDNHGMPIEKAVEEQMIKEGKWVRGKTIPSELKAELRKRCREYALHFTKVQNEQFQRLGVFGDFDNPYLTMSYEFEARVVEIFGELYLNGYIYRDLKTVHWCKHCVTALAEAELEYHEKESPSIYVRFKLLEDPKRLFDGLPMGKCYAVIWTTTPWTIPGNMAIAVNGEFTYAIADVKDASGDTVYYLIADALLPVVADALGFQSFKVIKEIQGEELKGTTFAHPLYGRPSPIILGEHVTLEQGTGLVHTAPGHGPEDFEICRREGIEIISPVDELGRFTDEAGQRLSGIDVEEGNELVTDWLSEVGALLKSEVITHSYPHCWRCRKPVIFRATIQWFMSVEHNEHRKRCLEEIEKVKWFPPEGYRRMKSTLEARPDWCLSRQRAWGVGIPIFYCRNCKRDILTPQTVKAVAELIRREGSDAWFVKPASEILPSGFKCPTCGCEEFEKETDILDVWFDSGSTNRVVLEGRSELRFPADVYLEGSDQHRGWFNSSLMISVATKGAAPYRTVITHGFVVDEQGRAMHKSLGNVISPFEVIDKHGADVLRLWVCSSSYFEDVRLGEDILARLVDAYRRLRNTLRFMLSNLYDFNPDEHMVPYEKLTELEKYILHRLHKLITGVTEHFERFEFYRAFQALQHFCASELSAFYFDVIKDRLYVMPKDSHQRRSAQTALFEIASALCRILFPMISHTAEEAWQHLPSWYGKEESVALASWAAAKWEWLDEQLGNRYEQLLRLRDDVHRALEIAKRDGIVINPLEARVDIYAPDEMLKFLRSFEVPLTEIFIVSQVGLYELSLAPKEAICGEEFPGVRIKVAMASGNKCARCWQRQESVGKNKTYDDLCERCASIVAQLEASGAIHE